MLEVDPVCDLILTDYQMPGMNGLEFAEKARALLLPFSEQSQNDNPSLLVALCSADYSTGLSGLCAQVGIEGMPLLFDYIIQSRVRIVLLRLCYGYYFLTPLF
jgi:CheY-like chemotaxis protein